MAGAGGGPMEEPLERQLEQLREETGLMLSMHQEGMRRCIATWSTRHQQLLRSLTTLAEEAQPLQSSSTSADADAPAVDPRLAVDTKLAMETNPSLAIVESERARSKSESVTSSKAEFTEKDDDEAPAKYDRKRLGGSTSTVWLTTSNRHATGGSSSGSGAMSMQLDTLRHMSIREISQMVAGSAIFQLVTAILILINVMLIGVETNYVAVHGESHIGFDFVQGALVIYFVLELLLRSYAWGIYDLFLHGEDRAWNIFDLGLIVTCFCDIVMSSVQIGGFVVLRMVRVCRLLRLAQVIKLLGLTAYFQEIRKIFLHLAASMRTLCWALLWVVFVIYVFAVLFTACTTDHLIIRKRQDWSDRDEQLHEDFGTVMRSIYSLYTAITGGRNWGTFMDPLYDVGWVYAFCFIGYVTFCFFGVLNIVTSVFVECAMQSTQRHRDLLVEDRRAFELGHLKHIRTIFKEIDMDHSGTVDYQELKRRLSDNVSLQDYFRALELNATDTLTLFELLDQDGSGELSIEEFVDGCMRLKGEARSFDINCLIQESKKTSKTLNRLSTQVNARFDKVNERISELYFGLPSLLATAAGAPLDEPWDPSKWTQLGPHTHDMDDAPDDAL